MDKEALKQKVCAVIDSRAKEIIEIGDYLLRNPELGFKETLASARVAETFKGLGLRHVTGLALTGVKAEVRGRSSGPTVAVLGELDGLINHKHPTANPENGAAHTCGHNAQVAAMLGVGMALVDSGAMEHLAGLVVLFAVPAEEYVELEYRARLREQGKVEFIGGKAELIRLGAFDDIDMAMMVHANANTPGRQIRLPGTTNGFLGKKVRFIGKAAHAGSRPDLGINALNAAALAIMGFNAQRETFRDEESVRLHYILTRGGDAVAAVPDDVRLEAFVRGKTVEAIMETSAKFDRVVRGAAGMVGGDAVIEDVPGYLPLVEESVMTAAFRANAGSVVGPENVLPGIHRGGSTDMGDVSHIMPALHPFMGGFRGTNHSEDFEITDAEMAYIVPAKAMAMTVVDLLWGDAALARRVKAEFTPKLTKAQYVELVRAAQGAAPGGGAPKA